MREIFHNWKCARFCNLVSLKIAILKTLSFHCALYVRCKMQDLAYLHMCKILHSCTLNFTRIQTLLLYSPYMQHEKCKVLHNGKQAKFCILANWSMQESRTYFLSPPLCQVQSARSDTFTQVQDFAFLHIKNVQVPRHSVLSPPIYKVQSERSCTFAHLQDFASKMCK